MCSHKNKIKKCTCRYKTGKHQTLNDVCGIECMLNKKVFYDASNVSGRKIRSFKTRNKDVKKASKIPAVLNLLCYD